MVAQSIPITLDKLRHLRFSANDIADLEEVLGRGFGGIFHPERMGIRTARAMLWAGLRHEDPTLRSSSTGIQKSGDLVEIWYQNGGTLPGLFDKFTEAMIASGWLMNAKEEGEPAPAGEDQKNSQSAG